MRIGATAMGYILALATSLPWSASAQLAPDTSRSIDAIVEKALEDKSVPSVSLAIVKDGNLAYAKAYGIARLDRAMPATTDMRYKIGSNTKQFVAAAMLLLVQDGKVSLDDKVARFIPDLTRANDVSVRQLLSHTAGYVDYYPLDYLATYMAKPTTVNAILADWGRRPLSFEPGTRWSYSNTGYAIAGRIIEIASGMSLDDFVRSRITDKLDMKSVEKVTGEVEALLFARCIKQRTNPVRAAARGPSRPQHDDGCTERLF
jgi:D-alanyl-D-alanine carboxypeptidase